MCEQFVQVHQLIEQRRKVLWMFTVVVVIVLLSSFTTHGQVSVNCTGVLGSWYQLDQYYFYVQDDSNMATTWANARAECKKLWQGNPFLNPVDLAILNSTTNAVFLKNFPALGRSWLGIYQLPGGQEPSGSWVYVDGNPVDFVASPWSVGSPDDTFAVKNCAMLAPNSATGNMFDTDCISNLTFVCALPGNKAEVVASF
jgi:hypothetical protein